MVDLNPGQGRRFSCGTTGWGRGDLPHSSAIAHWMSEGGEKILLRTASIRWTPRTLCEPQALGLLTLTPCVGGDAAAELHRCVGARGPGGGLFGMCAGSGGCGLDTGNFY